jgi:hypothetical protein
LSQAELFRRAYSRPLKGPGQWNSTFFAFSLIEEGITEKVLQFMMPLKSIYSQNIGFVEQKNVFLNTKKRFKE